METQDKLGGRTVELFIPFDHNGKRIERITLGPFLLSHTLRWDAGGYRSAIALICDLSGWSEALIGQLRYPDVSRVFEAFFGMLPPHIRTQMEAGEIPLPAPGSALVGEDDGDMAGTGESPAPVGEGGTAIEGDYDPANPWGNMVDRGPPPGFVPETGMDAVEGAEDPNPHLDEPERERPDYGMDLDP